MRQRQRVDDMKQSEVATKIPELLEQIHADMLERAETKLNKSSSRSHAVLQLSVSRRLRVLDANEARAQFGGAQFGAQFAERLPLHRPLRCTSARASRRSASSSLWCTSSGLWRRRRCRSCARRGARSLSLIHI